MPKRFLVFRKTAAHGPCSAMMKLPVRNSETARMQQQEPEQEAKQEAKHNPRHAATWSVYASQRNSRPDNALVRMAAIVAGQRLALCQLLRYPRVLSPDDPWSGMFRFLGDAEGARVGKFASERGSI